MVELGIRLFALALVFLPGIAALTGLTRYPNIAMVIATLMILLGMAGKISTILSQARWNRASQWASIPVYLFLIIYLIALVRGQLFGDQLVTNASWLLLVWTSGAILVCGICRLYWVNEPDRIFRIIIRLFMASCVINLILWAIGFTQEAEVNTAATNSTSSLLALFGFNAKRVLFPMSSGVNGMGIVAGVALTSVLCNHFGTSRGARSRSLLGVFMLMPPIACILLADNRGALLYSILAWLAARFFPRFGLRIVVALLVIAAIASFNATISGSTSVLSRSESSDDALSGRALIWVQALTGLSEFGAPQLIGNGAYGQEALGISTVYADLTDGVVDESTLISVHNGFLQIVLDTGYVGLVVSLMALSSIFKSFRPAAKDSAPISDVKILSRGVLSFLVLQSLTEVSLTPYLFEPWFLLLAIGLMSLRINRMNRHLQRSPMMANR